jgi:regulator of replication initiation timing
MSASSALLAEAKHACDVILAGMRSQKKEIELIKPEIQANAEKRLTQLDKRCNALIDKLQEKGPSQKRRIFMVVLKMTNLYQMSEDIQQDMEKRIEECDRLYASAESLKKDLSMNAPQNESTLKSNLIKMAESYNFLMRSVKDFRKRYDLFNQTYNKIWADFSVNSANSVKKIPNQTRSSKSSKSNKLDPLIMQSSVNKLRQRYKSPHYVASFESLNEENNTNQANQANQANAESSGGRRYKKRTLRTLRKKRTHRKRTHRNRA